MPTAVNSVVLVTEFGGARVARTIVFSRLWVSLPCVMGSYWWLIATSEEREEGFSSEVAGDLLKRFHRHQCDRNGGSGYNSQ